MIEVLTRMTISGHLSDVGCLSVAWTFKSSAMPAADRQKQQAMSQAFGMAGITWWGH